MSSLLFFYGLAERDLWSSHEARAGMDAQDLLDQGGWMMPRLFDGRLELQKPPLYYWLVAAIARLRGGRVDPWAVRLPAAGSALLCVLGLTLGLGWGRGRPLASLLAGLILATAVHFTWLARTGRIDMPLTLAVTVAAGCVYLARKTSPGALRPARLALLLIAYLSVAAGVMFKGPIGAVLPAAVIGTHLLLERVLAENWRWGGWLGWTGGLGLWWGVPLLLALTLPWFLWAHAATAGEFTRVFLVYHNVERALGGASLRASPWWLYGARLACDFLPWSPVLLAAVVWSVWQSCWRTDPDLRFGLTWLVAVLLVLSCARFKRADYLLPAYPGAALFLGCAVSRWLQGAALRSQGGNGAWLGVLWTALLTTLAGVGMGWVLWVGWLLPAAEPEHECGRFAAEVRRHAPAPQEVLFFRTEAHPLAFHVGRPLAVLVDWEDLRARLLRPGVSHVVMPPEVAAQCPQCLHGVQLQEVLRNTELSGGRHEHPLVLLRGSPSPAGRGNPKSEARNPKQIQNPKLETRNATHH